MLTVEQARARVLAATHPLPAEPVAVTGSLGRVLAEDVHALRDVPAFANSAMDGFAIQAGPPGRTLTISGESRAGTPSPTPLRAGEAIRISTGAMLPEGADAVIMVERTTEQDGTVTLNAGTAPHQNVRDPGGDVHAGAQALRRGTRIGPAELGVAITAGRDTVACARRPRVAVLSTGDELVPPGAPLGPGQVHDSNAPALAALATQAGADIVLRDHVPDDRDRTEEAIRDALVRADLLILSGGVSVGPHDHVKPALEACGVREDFWRVALRPGKPTWFGTHPDGALVLGLPGNPVSAMVTFLLFARPALARLQGADPTARRVRRILAEAVPRNEGRDELVRVHASGPDMVSPTGPQGSHRLSSMLGADGLAIVPAGTGDLPAGATVEVELL